MQQARALPDEPTYVQHVNCRHGNLIMSTPALRAIAEATGKPVGVWFDTESCAEMVRDAPFIRRLDERPADPLFDSRAINQRIPDYLYQYKLFAQPYGHAGPVPHTYVDRVQVPAELWRARPYIAIVRGSGAKRYDGQKNPPDQIYQHIVIHLTFETPLTVVLVGHPDDQRLWSAEAWEQIKAAGAVTQLRNDIRFALGAVRGALGVVANDTGLYHAAGALDKPLLALWKGTNIDKNRTPSDATTYSRRGNWKRDFKGWLDGLTSHD
jgi:ADP-heptose:LPS heptosyltransferase